MMRLDKYLCEAGAGTRSEVKELIRRGRITVNEKPAGKPDQKISETSDSVCLDGQPVLAAGNVYYMLNKPAGYVSSTVQTDGPSVLDLLADAPGKGLFPAGRLDRDTEGLLLITNDGKLSHDLLSPKKHVEKEYYAKIEGIVTEEDVVRFEEGLDIGEKRRTLPARLLILQSGTESEILLTIREGKFHQVKRMFEAVGKRVVYLKRVSMGSLTLDEALASGAYRPLTADELLALRTPKGKSNE